MVDGFSSQEKSPWPSNIKSFVLVLKRRGRFLCSFNAVTCFLFLQKKIGHHKRKRAYFKSSSLARRLLMSLPQGRKKVCTLSSPIPSFNLSFLSSRAISRILEAVTTDQASSAKVPLWTERHLLDVNVAVFAQNSHLASKV